MHYFKRNIGDYHKKAGRLSMLQHGAYTLLIDACYDREIFPTSEEAIDWCWASNKDEIEAVEFVLKKFFFEEDGLFIQHRIQDEIDNYHKNSATNKQIALKREAKRREKSTKRVRKVNEARPNYELITTNQELVTTLKDMFESFWSAGMTKKGKNQASKKFESILKKQANPREFTTMLIDDVQKRLASNQMGFADPLNHEI